MVTGASLRERIERAILSDLEALPYLKTRRPYDGELGGGGEPMAEEVRRNLSAQAPAVLVYTGAGAYVSEQLQRRLYTKDLEVRLLLCARSFRSRLSTKHGEPNVGSSQVGVYKMLEDATNRLAGWDLDLDGVGPLKAGLEVPIVQDADLCIWGLNFSARVDVQAPNRDELVAGGLTELVGSVGPSEDEGILVQGTGDSFSVAGSTVTLVDAGASFTSGMVGLRVRVAGAFSAVNNHDFVISAVPSSTQLQFVNPDAMPETFAGTWKVLAPAAVGVQVEVES